MENANNAKKLGAIRASEPLVVCCNLCAALVEGVVRRTEPSVVCGDFCEGLLKVVVVLIEPSVVCGDFRVGLYVLVVRTERLVVCRGLGADAVTVFCIIQSKYLITFV